MKSHRKTEGEGERQGEGKRRTAHTKQDKNRRGDI